MVGRISNKTGWYRCTLPNNEGLILYKNFERRTEYGLMGDGKTFYCNVTGIECIKGIGDTMYESEPTEEEKTKILTELYREK